eukprot:Phypoly_transcript_09370.p1 GENE.Phypoly_transcript_09370~~Phypoly_transcript_09370.p1  ORF type:complete len:396 (+),score=43.87 Phypoly_transcript_09370:141-1328(+)
MLTRDLLKESAKEFNFSFSVLASMEIVASHQNLSVSLFCVEVSLWCKRKMNLLAVAVAVLLPACVLAQTCGTLRLNASVIFDLSSLSSPTGYTTVSTERNPTNPNLPAYTWAINFCRPELLYNTTIPVIGAWAMQCVNTAPPSACMPVGTSLLQMVYQNNEILLSYVNKDCCTCRNNVFRTLNIHLTCNLRAETPIIGNVTESASQFCSYDVSVQSKAACPSYVRNSTECCAPHDTPGCNDINLEECVCKSAPSCCTSGWDSNCVSYVESLGCGSCSLGPCCVANGGIGCEDRQISKCVCEKMTNCCTTAWDSQCATAVNKFGCGSCPAACCGAGPCNDPQVRECVCSRDAYCCATQWDATCVEEAKQFNCTFCPESNLMHKTSLPRPLHYSLLE